MVSVWRYSEFFNLLLSLTLWNFDTIYTLLSRADIHKLMHWTSSISWLRSFQDHLIAWVEDIDSLCWQTDSTYIQEIDWRVYPVSAIILNQLTYLQCYQAVPCFPGLTMVFSRWAGFHSIEPEWLKGIVIKVSVYSSHCLVYLICIFYLVYNPHYHCLNSWCMITLQFYLHFGDALSVPQNAITTTNPRPSKIPTPPHKISDRRNIVHNKTTGCRTTLYSPCQLPPPSHLMKIEALCLF